MDYTAIKKIEETVYSTDASAYLETGRWQLLGVADGKNAEGEAYHLYSLGWLGKADEDDRSEFPELPSRKLQGERW